MHALNSHLKAFIETLIASVQYGRAHAHCEMPSLAQWFVKSWRMIRPVSCGLLDLIPKIYNYGILLGNGERF